MSYRIYHFYYTAKFNYGTKSKNRINFYFKCGIALLYGKLHNDGNENYHEDCVQNTKRYV